jgi:hypothetical protein
MVRWPRRQIEWPAVHLLEAVPEHRPIDFVHQCAIDVDDVIRSDAEQVCIECSVVDFAEAQTVLDDRKAVLFVVANDVAASRSLPCRRLHTVHCVR